MTAKLYTLYVLFLSLLVTNITFSQDIIIKTNREEFKAKIIEINDNTIKYKKIDFLEGPVYNINKADVFMILYSNGKRETIEQIKSETNETGSPQLGNLENITPTKTDHIALLQSTPTKPTPNVNFYNYTPPPKTKDAKINTCVLNTKISYATLAIVSTKSGDVSATALTGPSLSADIDFHRVSMPYIMYGAKIEGWRLTQVITTYDVSSMGFSIAGTVGGYLPWSKILDPNAKNYRGFTSFAKIGFVASFFDIGDNKDKVANFSGTGILFHVGSDYVLNSGTRIGISYEYRNLFNLKGDGKSLSDAKGSYGNWGISIGFPIPKNGSF